MWRFQSASFDAVVSLAVTWVAFGKEAALIVFLTCVILGVARDTFR